MDVSMMPGRSAVAAKGKVIQAEAKELLRFLRCWGPGAQGEAIDPESVNKWSYAGPGRGSYIQVDPVSGEEQRLVRMELGRELVSEPAGHGRAGSRPPPPGSVPLRRVICTDAVRSVMTVLVYASVMLLCIGVCCLIVSLYRWGHPDERPADPFDCQTATDTWGQAQQDWCCDNKGINCPPFDCLSELTTWEYTWSAGKSAWCCRHQHLGCPNTPVLSAAAVAKAVMDAVAASGPGKLIPGHLPGLTFGLAGGQQLPLPPQPAEPPAANAAEAPAAGSQQGGESPPKLRK